MEKPLGTKVIRWFHCHMNITERTHLHRHRGYKSVSHSAWPLDPIKRHYKLDI